MSVILKFKAVDAVGNGESFMTSAEAHEAVKVDAAKAVAHWFWDRRRQLALRDGTPCDAEPACGKGYVRVVTEVSDTPNG